MGYFHSPPAAANEGLIGDTPNPGKGLRPLHSQLIAACAGKEKGI